MPTDWGWIVQRPHFLALELGKYYDVKVVYLKQYIKRWKSQKNILPPANSKYGLYLPRQEKISLFRKISEVTLKKAMGDINGYDAVVIGTPMMYSFIENYRGKVIYDCMDNYVALTEDESMKKEVELCENQLIERSDLILVSSKKLADFVYGRRKEANVVLVRNGYNNKNTYEIKKEETREQYHLGYIGTISSWFNFKMLHRCVSEITNVMFHLLGPAMGYEAEAEDRIVLEGVIEHEALYDKIQNYDCLIMPFVLNDIILAVDPVKLYEYISFGKCIISIYYDEIARFEDFVYFYHDDNEFVELVENLGKKGFPAKYNKAQQREFLESNSWEVRGKLVDESIKHFWDKTRSN